MTPVFEKSRTGMKKISFEWTSDASGNASGVTTTGYSGHVELIKVTHVEGYFPAAAYDIEILDEDGDDIACGALTDIAPVQAVNIFGCNDNTFISLADSPLTFQVSNAGSGKKGNISVYLR